MDLSPAHEAARITACRVPALQASLDLLVQADPQLPGRATIHLYGGTRPAAGESTAEPIIVSIPMTDTAGTVLGDPDYRIEIATPVEAQIDGADPATGSIPTWARIEGPDGAWWADASVTVEGGGGEIQLVQTGEEGDPAVPVARLYNGAFARIASAVLQG